MFQVKSFLKAIIRQMRAFQDRVYKWYDIAVWRMFKRRPALNAAVADAYANTMCSSTGIPDTVRGRSVHVRIAFHYVPQRLKYLIETLEAVKEWPFDEIDIWIDTNTPKLIDELKHLPVPCRVTVWDALDHPFKLTWMHRGEMRKRLNDFSAFAYLEDDIIVPAQTMRRWLVETPRLAPHGLLPGLVRVEESRAGELMLSDYCLPVSRSLIVEIDGRPYLNTPYPYHACWIYDAAQMRELNDRPGYLTGTIEDPSLYERDGPPAMREQVALGLKFVAVPEGYQSRSAIPLTKDLLVSPDALVFHSPCNYAFRTPPHPAGLGQIPVSGIFSD